LFSRFQRLCPCLKIINCAIILGYKYSVKSLKIGEFFPAEGLKIRNQDGLEGLTTQTQRNPSQASGRL
jgi:hypothetical protein